MAGLALLLLAAFALVEVGRLVRDARRARRLNRAMHELRRPLQAIAMSLATAARPTSAGAEACLRQARCALRELDAIVNGGTTSPARRRVGIGDVDRGARAALAVRRRRGGGSGSRSGHRGRRRPARGGARQPRLQRSPSRHRRGPGPGGLRRRQGEVRGPRFRAPRSARLRASRSAATVTVSRWPTEVVTAHGGALVPPCREPRGGTLAAISLPVASHPAGG